jgi:hypothetical protein
MIKKYFGNKNPTQGNIIWLKKYIFRLISSSYIFFILILVAYNLYLINNITKEIYLNKNTPVKKKLY